MNNRKLWHYLNILYYYYRRSRWILRPDLYYFSSLKRININGPIFFVGHQGNGSTLVSRTIRRIEKVVTVTGDHNYFTGADEMQSVMGPILPGKFTGIIHKVPKVKDFSIRRGWTYACNDLLPYYKFSEYDYNENDAEKFTKAIKLAIKLHSNNSEKARFLDKSQSYALKIPLIQKILFDSQPKFVAIFRNPYAVCWRSAYFKSGLSNEKLNIESKLRVACEHWHNSFKAVYEQKKGSNVYINSIEDILKNFEEELYKIADFLDLELTDEHFPKEDDRIPFGSKRRERWYPVRKEINEKYLAQIPEWASDLINDICVDGIQYFNYSKN